MAAFVKRVLRELDRSLIAFGMMYTSGACQPGPPDGEGESQLRCPPAGHPEQLRPDIALTPLERKLERELRRGR
ncbi:DUF6059 family protein [Streptomyces phaeochromogenes]